MNPDHGKGSGPKEEIEVIKFSNSSSFNFGYIFISVAVIVSLGATYFFWSANQNITTSLNQKKSEKDAIVAEIISPTYKDVEQNATDFKSAIDQLKTASTNRYIFSTFLTEFYKKITNDIQISNLAITDKSSITFDGTTSSYRSVADLMVALKTWPVLSNVSLGTVSETIDDKNKAKVLFTMTANIDKTKQLVETTADTSTSTTSTDQTAATSAIPSTTGSTGGSEGGN